MFFKSVRWVCYHLPFNLIETAIKTVIFFKNIFGIFEPKSREVIESSSKAPFNFCPFKCTYLGKNSLSSALSQKNEIEKWPLITSVQCTVKPSKESSLEPVDWFSRNLVHLGFQPIRICSNDDPRLTLNYFKTRSNFVTAFSIRKSETFNF